MKHQLVTTLVLVSLLAGCASSVSTSDAPASTEGTLESDASSSTAEPTFDVAVNVPTMNCPFACWPKVKETLEGQSGVAAVTLAKQEQEGAIDNPTVYLELNGDFLAERSIAALEEAGFEGATVTQ